MSFSLLINGIDGKMGRETVLKAELFPQIKEIIGFDKTKKAPIESKNFKTKYKPFLIDFSSPEGSLSAGLFCLKNKIPAVIGTTGIKENQKRELIKYSKKIPIFISSNMSAAVNLTFIAVEFFAKNLDFDIHIHETHHTAKKDAPSGTALKYAEFIEKAGKKPQITSARIGDIKGEHEIVFAGKGEKIILKHCAFDRGIFSIGAIKAGLWLSSQKPRLYSFLDFFKAKL
ncbi:MAG: 4-hydroxy-tetrahydrodipicolinate reductase [Elusimicrobia bacterium]|nr:4-hydroxy-tetrahydrodipicolinate reductase [Elusimicrobiota bacterium]